MPVSRKTRKKWNNVIIIVSILMISILTFVDNRTKQLPNDAYPLFDAQSPLEQLQLPTYWLVKAADNWRCQQQVLNCQEWAQAWSGVHLSPLSPTTAKELIAQIESAPSNIPTLVTIKIVNQAQIQQWHWYQQTGILVSSADNFYQIPPSQRSALIPIISITPND